MKRNKLKSSQKRVSKDEKEEIVDAAVARMEDLFKKSGIMETASLLQQHLKRGTNFQVTNQNSDDGQSEVTVYRNAVRNLIPKRNGSS